MAELYLKYGGMPFWAEFIDTFYERATTDSALQSYFAGKDVQRIKDMQLSLLEMTLTGGHFSDQQMYEAHKNLAVSDALFKHFISLYEGRLIELGVDAEDATYMTEMLLGYKKQVVLEG
jgi:truncated hemoglobin YjbI